MFSTTCLQDFFDFPEEIVEVSKTIEWHKNKYGISPGFRSAPIDNDFPNISSYITTKILSQYYDVINLPTYYVNVMTHFNLVPIKHGTGLTHRDETTLTCIIFLSKDILDCGTKILKRNNLIIPNEREIQEQRKAHFETDEQTQEWTKNRDFYNSQFTEIARVNSLYNSAIIFDGTNEHSMYIGDNVPIDQDRLTLIQFVNTSILPDDPSLRFSKARAKYQI